MSKKLPYNPTSFKEVWSMHPKGIYKYQQSQQYRFARALPAILWVIWQILLGPLVFHIRPYSSVYSSTVPIALAIILSILIDYRFYKMCKVTQNSGSPLKNANFYIYFSMDNKQQADQLEKVLTKKQFKVDAHKMEDMWSLVISKVLHGRNELKAVQKELEALAAEYSGEYDGHEIEV